jgi:hypothetical protein
MVIVFCHIYDAFHGCLLEHQSFFIAFRILPGILNHKNLPSLAVVPIPVCFPTGCCSPNNAGLAKYQLAKDEPLCLAITMYLDVSLCPGFYNSRVISQLFIVHHEEAKNSGYNLQGILVDIESFRSDTSKTVKRPESHQGATKCES